MTHQEGIARNLASYRRAEELREQYCGRGFKRNGIRWRVSDFVVHVDSGVILLMFCCEADPGPWFAIDWEKLESENLTFEPTPNP